MRKGYKIALKDGCPGCGHPWGTKEGQCSKCKRCLQCCGNDQVEFSCDHRYARRVAQDPGYEVRRERAYRIFHSNPKVLPDVDRGID